MDLTNNIPLISVIIPTHNRVAYLEDCLKSLINQTYSNYEIIVINDNSKDNTELLLNNYTKNYNFIKYFNSNQTGGNAARNLGVEKANGNYIAFMDDDDFCEIDRLERQMKVVMDNNFKYDFIISGYYILNNQLKKIKKVDYRKKIESIGFPQRWLIKKEIIINSGLFDINQPALQDVEFYWRLRENAQIKFDNYPVVSIRNSEVSITKNSLKMISGIKRLLELHGNKMNNSEKNLWNIQLCKQYAKNKNWLEYNKCLKTFNKNIDAIEYILLYATLLFKNYKIIDIHKRIIKNK